MPFQIGMIFQICQNLCLANDKESNIREKSRSVFFSFLGHYFWTISRFFLGLKGPKCNIICISPYFLEEVEMYAVNLTFFFYMF